LQVIIGTHNSSALLRYTATFISATPSDERLPRRFHCFALLPFISSLDLFVTPRAALAIFAFVLIILRLADCFFATH